MDIVNSVSGELKNSKKHDVQNIFSNKSYHDSFESDDKIHQSINGGTNLIISADESADEPGTFNIQGEYRIIKGTKYRLKSIIIHNLGNYYTYLRKGNRWNKVNDLDITKNKQFKDIQDDVNQHHSTLFYEKV